MCLGPRRCLRGKTSLSGSVCGWADVFFSKFGVYRLLGVGGLKDLVLDWTRSPGMFPRTIQNWPIEAPAPHAASGAGGTRGPPPTMATHLEQLTSCSELWPRGRGSCQEATSVHGSMLTATQHWASLAGEMFVSPAFGQQVQQEGGGLLPPTASLAQMQRTEGPHSAGTLADRVLTSGFTK